MVDLMHLDNAADSFLEAGVNGADLSPPLERLTSSLGANCAGIVPLSKMTAGPWPQTKTAADLVTSYMRGGWYLNDVRMTSVPRLLKYGLSTDQDIIDIDGMSRSPFYQEFLRPLNLKWFIAIRLNIGDEIWGASIQRTGQQGPFTRDERIKVQSAIGRISRGASMAVEMNRSALRGLTGFYDAFERPVILLDRMGDVTQINRAAERLIGSGLQISNRRIKALPADNDRLDRFVQALVSFEEPMPQMARENLLVRRTTGRPLVMSGQRLSIGRTWDYFAQSRAVLVINDPDERPATDEDLLCRMFGLTRSEARLSVHLFLNDGDLLKAAGELSLTYQSARTYLRSIFQKTEVSSQTQLLLILARVFERQMR
jgi:PAS domain-containing protein